MKNRIDFLNISEIQLQDTLSCLSKTSEESIEYSRGVLIGCIKTITSIGAKEEEAFLFCMNLAPPDFRISCIPGYLLYLQQKRITMNLKEVVSYKDLLDSLPDEIADVVKEELLNKYLYLVSRLEVESQRAKKPRVILNAFNHKNDLDPKLQRIANFEVRDENKELDMNRINWHGQFTSQWVWAGCILVQDNHISIHT
uniref:Uncharacterized protein n=1 Tax=viral metagenome TaxID=1070528 RepID=A0A6M3LDM7_9ZZZZ